jgi:putative heme iron utilization protein
MESASIQFFDKNGSAMFKVFVRRTPDKKLDLAQLAKFESLAERLADATSNAA